MQKLTAILLAAALGFAGMAFAKPAEARVYVGVGIGLPGVALVAPPVVGVYPYGYARPYVYGPGFRYGYGWPGYGYHGYHGRRWR
jgi:hypothetical protein